jgi:hypothetical protein
MKRPSHDACMQENGSFNTVLGGVPIIVNYARFNNKECRTTFSYLGRLHEFKMSRWSGTGWAPFVTKFHVAHRDIVTFGSSTIDDNGMSTFDVTPEQLNAIVIESASDVFKYLDVLLISQQKQILDYSVWYRDRNPPPETYEEYIQLVTCHCIVHSQFLAGNLLWTVVPFVI